MTTEDDLMMTLSEIDGGGADSAAISAKDDSQSFFGGMSSSDVNEGSTARNRGTSPAIK